MKNVTMIAAIGKNNELGKNNDLIWRIKEDLQFFKDNTMGKKMIMGYNTFMSLRGGKPLPGRHHVILTSKTLEQNDQITTVHTLDELLNYIKKQDDEVMVIGGASIYNQLIDYADKLLITEINDTDDNAEVYFPKIEKTQWKKKELCTHTEGNLEYKHIEYKKGY